MKVIKNQDKIAIINIEPSYLAGLIDSDGSLTVSRIHPKRPNVSYVAAFQISWMANEKSISIFHSLKEKYGGSFGIYDYTSSFTNSSKSKSGTIKYMLTGRKLKELIKDVLPFLKLKTEQAYNCLTLIDINKQNCGKKNRSIEISKELENLWIANKNLNFKNTGEHIIQTIPELTERYGLK